MKTQLQLTLVVASFFIHASSFGQGALTPPGAPAATMKTLAQLDAKLDSRTPISSVPYAITQPGSYYLTTNLTATVSNAIVITASGVTLDLNGFTISSTVANAANGGAAILLAGTATAGLSDLTIVNGHIRSGVTNNAGVYGGSGFGYGIYYSGPAPVNVLVSRVSATGCLYAGIWISLGDSIVVESCTARTAGNYGIYASTIKQSSAIECGGAAIYGNQVSDCRGEASGNGVGIQATTAQNCQGSGINGTGVQAEMALNCSGTSFTIGVGVAATTALNCYGASSGANGVSANTVQNCLGFSSTSNGIFADTAENCSGFGSSSGTGVNTKNAQNCQGASNSGTGLIASDVATGCRGQSSTGTGLSAFIANSCRGTSTTGIPFIISHNLNSF